MFEAQVDKDLSTILEVHDKARETLSLLSRDAEVSSLLEQANRVSIGRMGYNDHGRVHAKIVALNSIKIFSLLGTGGPQPNIVHEKIGDNEDVILSLLMGSYLHDIGISVSRDSHDLLGVVLAKNIVSRILPSILERTGEAMRMTPIILEEILCHLGHYRATSLEAKIVATADGTDMTKGRARIPSTTAKPDIHQFSALAVENVTIAKGEKKPVRINIEMSDTAGVFQIEHQLLQKIADVHFEDQMEIIGTFKDGRKVSYLV